MPAEFKPDPLAGNDYDALTDEYINRTGYRVKLRTMTNDHLEKVANYVQNTYGPTKATLAIRRELTNRATRKKGLQPPGGYSWAPTVPIYPELNAPVWGTELGTYTALGMSALQHQLTKGTMSDMANTQLDQLYEVAILQDNENESGKVTTNLVLGPEPFLARDAERAKLAAVAKLARAGETSTDNIRVLVRAF